MQLIGALGSLVAPYADLLGNTWANLVALGKVWRANPFPFARRVLANQIGYARDIVGALFHGDFAGFGQAILDTGKDMRQNFVNVLRTAFDFSVGVDPPALRDGIVEPSAGEIITAVLSGNFHDLIQRVVDSIDDPDVSIGAPLVMLIDALGAPILGWNAVVDSIKDVFGDLRDGDWWGAFTGVFTAPAHFFDAVLNGSGVSLNILGAFGRSPGDLVGQRFDLGSQPVDVPLLGSGTARLGDITVKSLAGTIPLGGILTRSAHPDVEATVEYSGGRVVFHERLLTIIGGTTPPPININAYPGTFDISRELAGTPLGGIIPALLNWLPQQFAEAITPTD